MNVRFAHPLTSDLFEADVAPQITASLAVRGLIDAKFLKQPARGSYDLTLTRTQASIAPNETFEAAAIRAAIYSKCSVAALARDPKVPARGGVAGHGRRVSRPNYRGETNAQAEK